jgi:hypothetical protein
VGPCGNWVGPGLPDPAFSACKWETACDAVGTIQGNQLCNKWYERGEKNVGLTDDGALMGRMPLFVGKSDRGLAEHLSR